MKAPYRYKNQVQAAFSRAQDYDLWAQTHTDVAQNLADWINKAEPAPQSFVLEVGGGTGCLAQALMPRLKPLRWLCTDISPAMLGRARTKLGQLWPQGLFAAMDMEKLAVRPCFDLVVSSMALQWAVDMRKVLAGLWQCLRPGGILAVAVPGDGTFRQWRQACEDLGLECGLRDFPRIEDLAAMLPGPGQILQESHRINFAKALDFPRYLKGLGGNVPKPGGKPLPPKAFRAVLNRLDADSQGLQLDYQVLLALAIKEHQG